MSNKEVYYKQCTFESPLENGVTRGIAWIPEKLAVVGQEIFFGKREDRETAAKYIVTQVPEFRAAGSYLQKHERDFTTQREASDI